MGRSGCTDPLTKTAAHLTTTAIFSIFFALTFLAAAFVFSVNLLNMTQQNANNNNNNNNNNENMNMNMNMNSKKRSLNAPYVEISNVGGNVHHREKRWDHIFNLVEFPKGEII